MLSSHAPACSQRHQCPCSACRAEQLLPAGGAGNRDRHEMQCQPDVQSQPASAGAPATCTCTPALQPHNHLGSMPGLNTAVRLAHRQQSNHPGQEYCSNFSVNNFIGQREETNGLWVTGPCCSSEQATVLLCPCGTPALGLMPPLCFLHRATRWLDACRGGHHKRALPGWPTSIWIHKTPCAQHVHAHHTRHTLGPPSCVAQRGQRHCP